MRIALDVSTTLYDRGGSSVYVHELCRAIGERLDPTEQFLTLCQPGRSWPRGGLSWKAQVLFGDLVWTQALLPWKARRVHADVLHCPTFKAPLKSPCPLVVTIHDAIPLRFPDMLGKWAVFHARRAFPRVIRAAERVITVSEHVRSDLAALFPEAADKLVVVPEGVSSDLYPRDAKEVARVRQAYGIDYPFVLTVGTLEPRKNLTTLVTAFGKFLDKERGPWHLVVVGARGWLMEDWETTIRRIGGDGECIRWLGYVPRDDLAALYTTADLFVFPSLYEGFGLPPLEAMACGCPVIASNRGSLPEVLGDAAVLVEPTDSDQICSEMLEILHNHGLKNSMKDAGTKRAGSFTWMKTATKTLEIYRDLAE